MNHPPAPPWHTAGPSPRSAPPEPVIVRVPPSVRVQVSLSPHWPETPPLGWSQWPPVPAPGLPRVPGFFRRGVRRRRSRGFLRGGLFRCRSHGQQRQQQAQRQCPKAVLWTASICRITGAECTNTWQFCQFFSTTDAFSQTGAVLPSSTKSFAFAASGYLIINERSSLFPVWMICVSAPSILSN